MWYSRLILHYYLWILWCFYTNELNHVKKYNLLAKRFNFCKCLQVSTSLPKTSYFKMVDVWLLFCIVMIFLIIIFHAIIDYYLEFNPIFPGMSQPQSDSEGGRNSVSKVRPINGIRSPEPYPVSSKSHFLELASRISIFGLFVLFNMLYWGIILGWLKLACRVLTGLAYPVATTYNIASEWTYNWPSLTYIYIIKKKNIYIQIRKQILNSTSKYSIKMYWLLTFLSRIFVI